MAEKTKTTKHEPKPIKPQAVTVQQTGFSFKTVVVDMPDDITLDDVGNHPEIWKLVQADRSGKSLVEDDKVEMRWFDKRAWAVVDHADNAGVSFINITKASKRDRDRVPYTDGTYEVRWTDGGWGHFRAADGVRMGSTTWPTPQAAKAELGRLYPAKVA